MNQANGRTLSNEQAINTLALHSGPCTASPRPRTSVFEVTDGTKRILKQGIPAALAHRDYNLRTQILGARRATKTRV